MSTATENTITVADGTTLPLDLDGDPYRVDETLGAWKVTPCCGAYATGVCDPVPAVVCKGCYHEVYTDGPARLPLEPGDEVLVAAGITDPSRRAVVLESARTASGTLLAVSYEDDDTVERDVPAHKCNVAAKRGVAA